MEKSFLAIDFETANAQRVSACSLGCVKVIDGDVVSKQSYLIKPVGEYSPINIKIHGITPDMTNESPAFNVIFDELRQDFESLPIVSYSPFDASVFNALAQYYSLSLQNPIHFIDAYQLARFALPGLPNYRLPTVAYHLHIPYQTHHDALCDAEQCAMVYLSLTQSDSNRKLDGLDTSWIDSLECLIRDIIADGVIELEEAYQLQKFLDVISDKGQLFQDMSVLVNDIVSDGVVTEDESRILIDLLDYALSILPEYRSSRHKKISRLKSKHDSEVVHVPDNFLPVAKDIPTKYRDRWAFVATHPFETLSSANIVITENGVRINRKNAEALVRKLGGNLKSAVSRTTDFCVVLGMPPECCQTSKVCAARQLQTEGSPVKILSEDDFLALAEASVG